MSYAKSYDIFVKPRPGINFYFLMMQSLLLLYTFELLVIEFNVLTLITPDELRYKHEGNRMMPVNNFFDSIPWVISTETIPQYSSSNSKFIRRYFT